MKNPMAGSMQLCVEKLWDFTTMTTTTMRARDVLLDPALFSC